MLCLVKRGAFFRGSVIRGFVSKGKYTTFRQLKNCDGVARPIICRSALNLTEKYPRTFATDSAKIDVTDDVEKEFPKEVSNLEEDSEESSFFPENLCKELSDQRLVVLGKSVLQSCLTEHLMETFPELKASEIVDLGEHLVKQVLPFSEKLTKSESAEQTLEQMRAKIYNEIGIIYEDKGQDATLDFVKGLHPFNFSTNEIELFCKLAHPRATLAAIMKAKDLPFEVRKTGRKAVSVFINDELVAEVAGASLVKAEYKACLSVLLKDFKDDISGVSLKQTERVFKKSFKDRYMGQRVVELSKNADGNYGLYLKGGELATAETDRFWRYNHIEPVYISKISESSPPATDSCLQEGDIILAVGDFTLKGLTIESAIRLMNKEDNITLTVKYDPTIKIKESFKSKYIERENKAFKNTLKTDSWRRWHEARVENDPEKYFKMK